MTFQLTQEAQEAEKNKFKKALPWLSITFFPMLLCAFYPNFEFTLFLLGICCFFCFLGYFLIRSITNMRLSTRISFDGDKLTSHIDGQPDKIINRNEIKKVIEIPKEGLQINSINSSQVIRIPLELEGFQILKTELATWALPTEPSKTEFKLYLVGVYGTLAIVISAIFLKSKFLWGLVFTIMAVFFIYGFIQKIRSLKGIAKWAPFIVPLILALIAFILTKIIK
jgi:hypothetical protein